MYIASNGVHTAVIMRDPEPQNPRDPDYQDNLSTMVCWHDRYRLGDTHAWADPHDFAEHLADQYVDTKSLLKAIRDGKLKDIRLTDAGDGYQVEVHEFFTRTPSWTATDWRVSKDLQLLEDQNADEFKRDLLPYGTISELIHLCNESNQVAILPLFLYDHTNISISTGSFLGRAHHAEWDSGPVGFIYMGKERAMEELAMAGDRIHLASALTNYGFKTIRHQKGMTKDEAMKANGYEPLRKEDIINPESNQLHSHWLNSDVLFKKENGIYVFEQPLTDTSFQIRGPVASFNPELLPLTDETWRNKAEEIMRGEVEEYDNYLTGEVYGIRKYEGCVEIECTWDYNPGPHDIRDQFHDLLDGWHPELSERFSFKYDPDSDFDIDDYLENEDFPEYRGQIEQDVQAYITFEQATAEIYPFAIPAEDIISNKEDILDHIVETIYDTHVDPTTEEIYSTILEHAGLSPTLTPKLRAEDLVPGQDYTASDLLHLLQTKQPTLDELLSDAIARHDKYKEQGSVQTPVQER